MRTSIRTGVSAWTLHMLGSGMVFGVTRLMRPLTILAQGRPCSFWLYGQWHPAITDPRSLSSSKAEKRPQPLSTTFHASTPRSASVTICTSSATFTPLRLVDWLVQTNTIALVAKQFDTGLDVVTDGSGKPLNRYTRVTTSWSQRRTD